MSDHRDHEQSSVLRPYVLTGGETRATGGDLAVETLVTSLVSSTEESLSSERRSILSLASEPLSIAEIASRLDLPLGVARYLISDMVAAGLLDRHLPSDSTDDALIERLIRGIEAL